MKPARVGAGKVLVVDDEKDVSDVIVAYLQRDNYQVTVARSGREARQSLSAHLPDLIVLDLMLPDVDGLTLCRDLRRTHSIPILMLSARGEDVDRIVGLEVGADDYMAKPFNPKEMVARVRALLRRAAQGSGGGEVLQVGNLRLLLQSRRAFVEESEMTLTPIEFSLLKEFLSAQGTLYTRQELLDRVWGPEFYGDERTVDSHIRNLRNKIRQHDKHFSRIQSVWGVGYRFT